MEIGPDTPPEGTTYSEKFKGRDIAAMQASVQQFAKAAGVEINAKDLISNSHLALLAGEYAKDQFKYDEFHERVFYAYFTEGRDIGDLDFLLQLATEVGLDADQLRTALEDGRYEARLEAAQAEAHALGIYSAPTFIINGRYKLTGAYPLDSFRQALQKIAAESQTE